MTIGVKATGTLSTGYLNALEVRQDPRARRRHDPDDRQDGTAVTIMHHPDVRRSLMTQKAYSEAALAVPVRAAHQNADVAQLVSGADPELAHRVDDLLLPVVKLAQSAYEILTESLQTLGGSGFRTILIEQYIRDAKIDSLYEGTTAIQAMDFFFRKIVRDHGQALAHVASVSGTIDSCDASLKQQAEQLRTALEDAGDDGDADRLPDVRIRKPDGDLQGRSRIGRYLLAGDLLIGWRLLAQANVAAAALAEGKDEDFYRGKIATAAFFASNMLPPGLTAVRSIIEAVDDEVMQLPEAAF